MPERAIPGGRQQDHQNGIILQQEGETFSGGAYRQTFQGGTITVPVNTWMPRITYR